MGFAAHTKRYIEVGVVFAASGGLSNQAFSIWSQGCEHRNYLES